MTRPASDHSAVPPPLGPPFGLTAPMSWMQHSAPRCSRSTSVTVYTAGDVGLEPGLMSEYWPSACQLRMTGHSETTATHRCTPIGGPFQAAEYI
jgi:hypothetical protein